MTTGPDATEPDPPLPLAYHREVVGMLKSSEPELWAWASSAGAQQEEAEAVRTGMLKTHYRLDADGHPVLTERAAAMAQRLGVRAPVTMYQAGGTLAMNAALLHFPGEAHIVFSGPVLEKLKGAELDALLAHELAHQRLWEMEGGDFLTADRLLVTAANDPRATASHVQTARRLRLYTEIFADRGALTGCGELHAAIAALVKTETGLTEVSAAGYLRQAEEIFARGEAKTEGIEHPETFIRARALRMWAERDGAVDEWLTRIIEGPLALDELDLAGQRRTAQLTRRFLAQLLHPRWFQTAAVLAHARAFFPDFSPDQGPDDSIAEDLATDDKAMREYWLYLLLDFAAVDRELEDVPLAAAITWARRMEMMEAFEKLALKELGVAKRQFTRLKKEAGDVLAKAEANP